jgi:hypothetical protein
MGSAAGSGGSAAAGEGGRSPGGSGGEGGGAGIADGGAGGIAGTGEGGGGGVGGAGGGGAGGGGAGGSGREIDRSTQFLNLAEGVDSTFGDIATAGEYALLLGRTYQPTVVLGQSVGVANRYQNVLGLLRGTEVHWVQTTGLSREWLDVALLPDGSSAFASRLDGALDIGITRRIRALTANGIVLGRLNQAGDPLWVRTCAPEAGSFGPPQVALLSDGSVVAAGAGSGKLYFNVGDADETAVSIEVGPNDMGMWMGRWSPTGDLVFLRTIGVSGSNAQLEVLDVAAAAGTIHVAGLLSGGTATFDPARPPVLGAAGMLASWSADGDLLRVRDYRCELPPRLWRVTADDKGVTAVIGAGGPCELRLPDGTLFDLDGPIVAHVGPDQSEWVRRLSPDTVTSSVLYGVGFGPDGSLRVLGSLHDVLRLDLGSDGTTAISASTQGSAIFDAGLDADGKLTDVRTLARSDKASLGFPSISPAGMLPDGRWKMVSDAYAQNAATTTVELLGVDGEAEVPVGPYYLQVEPP